jgi:hypothetical protein
MRDTVVFSILDSEWPSEDFGSNNALLATADDVVE